MLGVILCGGQSLRMGRDKGLLSHQDNTWARLAIDKVAALDIPVKISVNELQLPMYAAVFSNDTLIADNKTLPVKGPLLGVLSSHLVFPNEDIFLLACDMPLMDVSILVSLYKKCKEDKKISDVYLFTNDGEAEPLCAIYTFSGLSRIVTMLENGTMTKYSMKYVLSCLNVNETPLNEVEKKYFKNVNHRSELNDL